MFINVLGWSKADIYTEDPTGDGYIDYKFTIEGFSRLIVEAKRDNKTFGLKGKGYDQDARDSSCAVCDSPGGEAGADPFS